LIKAIGIKRWFLFVALQNEITILFLGKEEVSFNTFIFFEMFNYYHTKLMKAIVIKIGITLAIFKLKEPKVQH